MSTPAHPVYDHPPEKVEDGSVRRIFGLPLLENLFFGVATVFTFLFAVVILREGISNPLNVAYFIGFWLVVSYLALPRLNRVLTTIYVPDYFIGRARASDGVLGDPINLAFTGHEDQIHEVMRQAGWIEADPVDLASSVRIVLASITRRSYPQAPVSPLLLFGKTQAFAYQQEVAGNPQQRHHVRFWPTPPGWLLPGGHRVDWLASGTYDRKVGLSLFTFQVTHKIDRDIDVERDYIVASVCHADPAVEVDVLEHFSTGYHSRNGGGDAVITDGNLPVVEVGHVTVPRDDAPGESDDDLLHDVGRRPVSVVAASVLAMVSLLLSLWVTFGESVEVMADPTLNAGGDETETIIALTTTIVLLYGVLGLLAWFTFRGRQWARLSMLAILSMTQVSQLAQWIGSERPPFLTLVAMSVDILTIYALTSQSARQWTADGGMPKRSHRPPPRSEAARTSPA